MITLSNETPPALLPGAWAYALPYEGTDIVVFYDRLAQRWGPLAASQPIMAHVLAHEIAHILEGIDRHSEAGILKACWDASDYRQLRQTPLAFPELDAKLIHLGLDTRQSHIASTGARRSAAMLASR